MVNFSARSVFGESLIAALVQLAYTDGVFAEEERQMVAAMIGHYRSGADLGDLELLREHSVACESIVHRDLTIALCLMAAYIDGRYSPEEVQYVDALAIKLSVEKAAVDELHLAVKRKVFNSIVSSIVAKERSRPSEAQDLDFEQARLAFDLDEVSASEEVVSVRHAFR